MRKLAPAVLAILLGAAIAARAQEPSPTPKRGLFSHLFHPFAGSGKVPQYRNAKLNGLALSMQLPAEPIKLSEMRQLPVTIRLTNRGNHAIELDFPTDDRIDIYLHDAAGKIVTRWSDNRAFEPTPASVLINPNEHVEYAETIATRDLAPGRVFTVEVTVPAYPELDAKRKLLAAP
ncbi:MAG TPA: BsuPI-related putative proteinase inhibitor [Chthoniobacterales bacterium]|jgi:hypothetical protein